ncbi:MAG: hypothetical protein AseanaTS_20770 [Candidatus Pelagadaptatus aseana]
MVGAVAVLLTNVSIVATLLATGAIGDSEEEVVEEPQPEVAAEAAAEPQPPKPTVIHSMAKAMYVCEDKLLTSSSGKEISHQFDTVASRYTPDENKYVIFIETQTSSRNSAPQKDNSIICEVSDQDLSVKGWKVLPL